MSGTNLLEHRIIFDKPERIVEPCDGAGHIPLGFYLISALKPRIFVELGVNTGNSYNGFCQAVKKLGIDTLCYGIDNWKDRENTFNSLSAYQQYKYNDFSYLLKMSFNGSIEHFSDGSVDLLHINKFHIYEDVRHVYDNWLPKLSNRGVISISNIATRSSGFGVWKLWNESNM